MFKLFLLPDLVYPTHSVLYPSSSDIPTLYWILSSPEKVEKGLSGLDPALAMGPNSISPHVPKSCSAIPASPLSALFSLAGC